MPAPYIIECIVIRVSTGCTDLCASFSGQEGAVRLAEREQRGRFTVGFLEVFHAGAWGTLCHERGLLFFSEVQDLEVWIPYAWYRSRAYRSIVISYNDIKHSANVEVCTDSAGLIDLAVTLSWYSTLAVNQIENTHNFHLIGTDDPTPLPTSVAIYYLKVVDHLSVLDCIRALPPR